MSIYFYNDEYVKEKDFFIKTRLLGFDVGNKTIGISVSDENLVLATPLKLIERKSFKIDTLIIQKLIIDYCVSIIVVGLPLNLDGSLGTQAEKTISFIKKTQEQFPQIDFIFWDERFSTQAVERFMREASISKERKNKSIDKAAACFILQGFLDYLRLRK